jgi:hypothetical protein
MGPMPGPAPVEATICPQCGAPLPPFGARSSQNCGHCGATVRVRAEAVVTADLEKRVSALERIRAPIRRRFRRPRWDASEPVLSPGSTMLLETCAVVAMAALGAVVDGDAPIAGALAFGAVTGIVVLGLVLVSRSGSRRRSKRSLPRGRGRA